MDSNIPDTSLLFLDKRSYVGITRGRLPHWSQQGRALFVTFRLTDSLPQNRLDELARMKQEWLDTHPLPWSDDTLSEYEHKILVQVNKWLDAGYGSCILQRHDIRQVVTDALRFYDEKQYKLWAYVVMPNHVHLVASPIGDGNVMKPVGNAKRYSATMINRMQGRLGHLWQRELRPRRQEWRPFRTDHPLHQKQPQRTTSRLLFPLCRRRHTRRPGSRHTSQAVAKIV